MITLDGSEDAAEAQSDWDPADDGLGAFRGAAWALLADLVVFGAAALTAGWLW